MKSVIHIVIFSTVLSPLMAFAQATAAPTALPATPAPRQESAKPFPTNLGKGQSNDFVRDLQNILRSDPKIYPEGIVSGYYGQLTEEAIKRLQKKYGLPATGVVDENTQNVIFPPRVELQVIAPNGGETWDRSQPHTILWKATTGPVIMDNRSLIPEASSGTGAARPSIAPFFPRASLDLIRDSDPSFFRHIATVDLYQSQYEWRIPARIPEGKDYRVRISFGGNVPCLYRLEAQAETNILPKPCPLAYPQYSASDTSDNPFAVTGTIPPPPDVINKLKEQVRMLEQIANQLMNQIQVLKSLLDNL